MERRTLNERMDEAEELLRALSGVVMEIKSMVSISKRMKLVACKRVGRKPLNKKEIESRVRKKIRESQVKPGFKRIKSDKD